MYFSVHKRLTVPGFFSKRLALFTSYATRSVKSPNGCMGSDSQRLWNILRITQAYSCRVHQDCLHSRNQHHFLLSNECIREIPAKGFQNLLVPSVGFDHTTIPNFPKGFGSPGPPISHAVVHESNNNGNRIISINYSKMCLQGYFLTPHKKL